MNFGKQRDAIVRLIPAEIWITIFELCLDEESGLDATRISIPPRYRVLHEFIILSQVCSRWRDIVTTFRRFWSTIWVDLTLITESDTELLRIFLERSLPYLLDLHVFQYSISDIEETYPSIVMAWEVLADHLPRCKKLALYSNEGSLLTLQIPHYLPISLDELVTYEESFKYPEDDANWSECLWKAYNLRNVVIFSLKYVPPISALPYHQLTTLRLTSVDTEELLMLRRIAPFCGSLHRLIMEIVLDEEEELKHAPIPMNIPSLQQLTLAFGIRSFYKEAALTMLFESFIFPSLVDLNLRVSTYKVKRLPLCWPQILRTMLPPASKSLENLAVTLAGGPGSQSPTVVAPLLLEVPLLKTFSLHMDCDWGFQQELNLKAPNTKENYDKFHMRMLSDLFTSLAQMPALCPLLQKVSVLILDPEVMEIEVLGRLFNAASRDLLKEIILGRFPLTWEYGLVPEPLDISAFDDEVRALETDGANVVFEEMDRRDAHRRMRFGIWS